MAKHFVRIIAAGVQIIGTAFAKALRQELAASRAAASRAGGGTRGAEHSAMNQKLGMTIEEAKQILNLEQLDNEKIQKNYEYLFKINDKASGGSFYIQSKIPNNVIWHSHNGYREKPLKMRINSNQQLNYQFRLASNFHSSSTFTPSWDTILSDENRRQFLTSSQKSIAALGEKEHSANIDYSVLIPLSHYEGELCLLYTIRSPDLRTHGGELSFPGGRVDREDKSLIDAALRETEEEIGFDRNKIDVWGPIPSVLMPRKGGRLAGTLAYIGHIDENSFILNDNEVESIVVISLKYLCDPNNFRKTQIRLPHTKIGASFPIFFRCQPALWGMTAMITHVTLKILLSHLYTHKLCCIHPVK